MKSFSTSPFASLSGLRVRHFLLLALLAATACTASAADPTHIVAKGMTQTVTVKRVPYTIEATQAPYKADTAANANNAKPPCGSDNGKVTPKFICTSLSITIDGKKMELPEKAFTDLSDITAFKSPSFEMGHWLVPVKGGHESAAYEVEYMFKDTKLIERGYLGRVPGLKWTKIVWQRDKY
ncbi:MAG: hypothetical protein ABIP97_04120 [Chthoniobacterales bacterium]